MKKFDLRSNISILQALDEVGRAMFPESWTGSEPWSFPCDDPKALKKEKSEVAQRVREFSAVVHSIQSEINSPENETAKSEAQKRFAFAHQDLKKEEDRYQHFPISFDSWDFAFDSFRRRLDAESRLLEAFGSGQIGINYQGGVDVHWDAWRLQKGFKVYFNLAMIRVPHHYRSNPIVSTDLDATVSPENPRREPIRHSAFVQRNEFEAWLYSHEWAAHADQRLQPEERCRLMLEKIVSQTPVGKKKTRDDYLREIQSKIPGFSERGFLQVWRQVVPPSWQQAGRPRN